MYFELSSHVFCFLLIIFAFPDMKRACFLIDVIKDIILRKCVINNITFDLRKYSGKGYSRARHFGRCIEVINPISSNIGFWQRWFTMKWSSMRNWTIVYKELILSYLALAKTVFTSLLYIKLKKSTKEKNYTTVINEDL